LEFLTGTDPNNQLDAWKISLSVENASLWIRYRVPANVRVELLSSTTPLDENSWQPVESPANRPFYWSEPHDNVIEAQLDETAKFFTVRFFQP
jgi:hypothetical protein